MTSNHIIAVLMENEAGSLARVVGLFAQRGYNIETLTVAPSNVPQLSRLTLSVSLSDANKLEQICKQLNRLICVYKVQEISDSDNFIAREYILVKVAVRGALKRTELKNLIDIFGAKIVDLAPSTCIVQMTGSQAKIDALLNSLSEFKILELDRSGVCGLLRGEGAFSL